MWTVIISFFKRKVFSEAGTLLIPLLLILSIFLVWNSDTILTKFGFETTANLKAQVTKLQSDIIILEEANKKLKKDLERSGKQCTIASTAVAELCEVKVDTKTKVDGTTSKRKQESDRIKSQVFEIKTIPAPAVTQTPEPKEQIKPVVKTPTVHPAKVEALSLNNIQALHEAYNVLFDEV